MDANLSNSFFYFFSATPQVLGGILALFGVFIVFKIQDIRSQLLAKGKQLSEKINYIAATPVFLLVDNDPVTYSARLCRMGNDIKSNFDESDIDGLYRNILPINDSYFSEYQEQFIYLYCFLKSIAKTVIRFSIFTGVIIIFTLSVLPFGTLFLKHSCLLYCLFGFVIIGVIICFGGLIYILKTALNSNKIQKVKVAK